jgi:hypothetical protein
MTGKTTTAIGPSLKSITVMELEQYHISKFMHTTSLKLDSVTKKVSSLYRHDAYAKLSIKSWLHQLKLRSVGLKMQQPGERQPLNDADAEMLSVDKKFPCSLVRTIIGSLIFFH